MSSLLRFAAGLQRAQALRAPLQQLVTSSAPRWSPCALQTRAISQSPVLLKRKGGASAFVVKTPRFNQSKGSKKHNALRTKDKLKRDTAPHRSHLESTRDLKSRERANLRNAREWAALERDEELNRELDETFEYLDNLGAHGDYIYQPEPTLRDVDVTDALAKLNALARQDPDVLAELEATRSTLPTAQESVDGPVDVQAEAGAAASSGALDQELTVEDYNFLLRVYAVQGLPKQSNALLARMEENLTPPAELTRGKVVSATSADNVDVALVDELAAVPHRVAPNAQSYMLYATALAESKQAALAVRVLGRMKERGVLPDVRTYNAVMQACAKSGRVAWAYNVMEKMQVAGLVPDRASFTILMNAAIAEKDVDKAFETFHLMRTHVSEPDEVAFSCLINGFAREGRVEKALNLLEDLLECGLTPSQVTFNTLMNACAKSHYYAHKAVEFYHEMQELYDYVPDLYSYNTVLHACAKHGDFIQAEQIMRHMDKHRVPMDEVTYNTLLNVYARAQVKSVVDQAPRNNQPKPKKPTPVYQQPTEYDDDGREIDLTRPGKEVTSIANLNYDAPFDEERDAEFVDTGDVGQELSAEEQKQLEELREGDEKDRAVAKQSTELAPRGDASMEVYGEADELLFKDSEETLDFELTPMDLRDFGTFQTLNIKRAEVRFREMTEDKGLVPSRVTLNTMLNVYANALRLGSAESFLETFDKYKLSPDKYTFRALMHMYVRAKRTPRAEALMDRVKREIDEDELEPDAVTFGLLVDHYARKRLLRRALTLLEDADALNLQLQEKHLKQVRRLSERFGVFTDLIPEDPQAVVLAGSKHKLMTKRKVRADVLAYNRKVGKRFLLPDSV